MFSIDNVNIVADIVAEIAEHQESVDITGDRQKVTSKLYFDPDYLNVVKAFDKWKSSMITYIVLGVFVLSVFIMIPVCLCYRKSVSAMCVNWYKNL